MNKAFLHHFKKSVELANESVSSKYQEFLGYMFRFYFYLPCKSAWSWTPFFFCAPCGIWQISKHKRLKSAPQFLVTFSFGRQIFHSWIFILILTPNAKFAMFCTKVPAVPKILLSEFMRSNSCFPFYTKSRMLCLNMNCFWIIVEIENINFSNYFARTLLLM